LELKKRDEKLFHNRKGFWRSVFAEAANCYCEGPVFYDRAKNNAA